MPDSFIVTCAPNGARKTKDDHPALPVTPAELGACAGAILEAGAAMMHTHVRDERGGHSLAVDRYRSAIAAIRKAVGNRLVIQVTTEACGIYRPEQQMAIVRELRPEAVSLALREICADQSAETEAARFYAWLHAEHIMVQHILYSADEVRRFETLRRDGVIAGERPFALFVLGRYSNSLEGDVTELPGFVDAAAMDTVWAVCSFGPTEHAATQAAATLGGHARVGFENNVVAGDGAVASDNAALVRAAVAAGRAAGRPPATAADVRACFDGREPPP